MGKDGHDQRLKVYWRTEAATVEKRHGLGSAIEPLRAAGRDSERELFGLACFLDYAESVADQRFIHANLRNRMLHFQNVSAAEHRLHGFQLRRACFGAKDLTLSIAVGIAHPYSHQETIQLGFR